MTLPLPAGNAGVDCPLHGPQQELICRHCADLDRKLLPQTREDLIYALATLDRSEVWVFVTCDRDEDDGVRRLVNATGFYPNEWEAGLAGENYVRAWKEKMDEDTDPPPETFAIPLFINRRATQRKEPHDGC